MKWFISISANVNWSHRLSSRCGRSLVSLWRIHWRRL